MDLKRIIAWQCVGFIYLYLPVNSFAEDTTVQREYLNQKKGMAKVLFYNDYLKEKGQGYFLVDSQARKARTNVKFYLVNGVRGFCIPSDFFNFLDDIDNYIDEGDCINFPSKKHRWAHKYEPRSKRLILYMSDKLLTKSKFNLTDYTYGDKVATLYYKASTRKVADSKPEVNLDYSFGANLNTYKLRVQGNTARDNELTFAYIRKDFDSISSSLNVGHAQIYNDATTDQFKGITLYTHAQLAQVNNLLEEEYIYGFANVDSTVKVVLGDVIIKEVRVLSGDFSIIKPKSSSGESLKVIVEGDDGGEYSFFTSSVTYPYDTPYYYSFSMGRLESSGKPFLNLNNAFPLASNLRANTKIMASGDTSIIQASPYLFYKNLIINASFSNAWAYDGRYGISRFGFNYSTREHGFFLGGDFAFEIYNKSERDNLNSRSYLYLTKSFNNTDIFSLSYRHAQGGSDDQYTFSYIKYFFDRNIRVRLDARKSNENALLLSVRIPLFSGYLESGVDYNENEISVNNDYLLSTGDNIFAAGFSSRAGDLYESGRFNFSHLGEKAYSNFRYNEYGGTQNYYADVLGSFIFGAPGVFLDANKVESAYVFTGDDKYEVDGEVVGSDNYYVARVTPFKESELATRDTKIFSQAAIKQPLRIRDGEVKFVNLDGNPKLYEYAIILVDKHGKPFTPGEWALSEDNVQLTKIKPRGVVNFTSKADSLRLKVKLPNDLFCYTDVITPSLDKLEKITCE